MNTNSNAYTLIYTTVVVVIVAAALAFVSQKLGPMQAANEKAETISQILTAAQFGESSDWQAKGNKATVNFYKENLEEAFTVDAEGNKGKDLDKNSAEIFSTSDLKAQNYNIRDKKALELPVYKFTNGIVVFPIYGAGLWGPVWGYIALNKDYKTIAGVYFDHSSETPGLGGKIKDDPSFREAFKNKVINLEAPANPFDIVKGGVPAEDRTNNKVDAISGATMTSKGVDAAIDVWCGAYIPFLKKNIAQADAEAVSTQEGQSNE